MAKKNAYLEKQNTVKQTYLDIGEEMGMQKMWDYVQIALVNPKVMSTHALTKDRLKAVFAELERLAEHYKTAFTDDVEADYYQEELDGQLREVWEEELDTFFKRYPYIKQLGYDKPRKNWK